MVASPSFSAASALRVAASMLPQGQETVEAHLGDTPSHSGGSTQGPSTPGWLETASQLSSMSARPFMDRGHVTTGVVALRQQMRVLQVGRSAQGGQGHVPHRVILDSGAQPLILGRRTAQALGLTSADIVVAPFRIHTSMGATERPLGVTREPVYLHFLSGMPDATSIASVAVVTEADTYDILIGTQIMYPLGIMIDFWRETVHIRPGWQRGEDRVAILPSLFIYDPASTDTRTLGGTFFSFSSQLEIDAFMAPEVDTPPEEAHTPPIPSPIPHGSERDLPPPWGDRTSLHDTSSQAVATAWRQGWRDTDPPAVRGGPPRMSPLDSSPVLLSGHESGLVVFEPFGGMCAGLSALLETGARVRRYLYCDSDPVARQAAQHHVLILLQRYP
eukprot:TRINITY_DN1051_c1_g2_i1.p1 TRINITY_DN1051_c1_g2~~TRINITY_DN1051_c1_g2_i1.p1  ORF type:complete len:432 (+),score=59.32 TRINITY_DN1051_c1_g2_i1:132-1298(+)